MRIVMARGIPGTGRRLVEYNQVQQPASIREVLRKVESSQRGHLADFPTPIFTFSAAGGSLTRNRIMIVDDNSVNVMVLEEMLVRAGHNVQSFPLGRLALEAANENHPDLILLDITMPEMDGFEVCRRLKSDAALSAIPVIFLSALNDTQTKVKSFQYGAVDYISKPFEFEEVRARVATHLKVHHLQEAMMLQNELLEAAVAARTRELAEANERLTILDRSKSEFLNLISHEFRTPLNGLLGVGELILTGLPQTKENIELRGMFEQSRRRILSILDDAVLLTQIDVERDKLRSAPVSLHAAMRRAVERTMALAESRRVVLAPPSETPALVMGEEDLMSRAFHALLEAAVKFSVAGETVRITQDSAVDHTTVVIESSGRAIPDDALAKFFDLFSIAESTTPGGDLGLGAPVASRILSLFGASVRIANREVPGIRLSVSLRGAAEETSRAPSTG